ncbi:MAG: hypothetical protein ACLRQP_07135 [Bacteroides caccae]
MRLLEYNPATSREKNMASQPGGDMIVKVLTLYPDLSAEWLMRGEGNMLKSNNTDVSQNSYTIHQEISQDNKQEIEKYNAPPPEIVDKLLSTIKEQAEEIGMLKQTITQLKQDKSGRVSDAGSSTLAGAG